ncbi:MAG TPA: DUF4383 domain-containing protein [Gammaproteobacteria bacterium]|nr:DUF4383 domain-containing protein [Gammaproteobacteria bacterium]
MVRKFALIFGIIYLVVGVMGFIPGIARPAPITPNLEVNAEKFGILLGLFPINFWHNIVHLAVGLWGVLGSRTTSGAVSFSRGIAIFYGLLAILGLIPATDTLGGLVPIYSHDVWLHALSALIAAYFGFFAPRRAPGPSRA